MTFDEQLQGALDTFASRLNEEIAEVGRQIRVVGDELTAAAVRPDPPPPETAPVTGITGSLALGIRALSGARSLSEVFDTLVSCAGREAGRASVWIVRGEQLYGWRSVGFDPSFASQDLLEIAHGDVGIIADALQSATMASTGSDHAPAFAALEPGQACVAVPIVIGGQAVAVLYADTAENQEPGTENQEPGTKNPEPGTLNPEPLEILTLFAAQRLEALTAITAARSLIASTSPAAAGGRDDSGDQEAAARRYARLLVSEIKRYHEPQVAEGRRERDLATRLGGEIARVRTLYEQRVPAEIRQGRDYVHEELIRTLADGDASLLEAK